MTETYRVSCQHCGFKFNAAADILGDFHKCGHCGEMTLIPDREDIKEETSQEVPARKQEKVVSSCDLCGVRFKVSTGRLGKKLPCPKCGEKITVTVHREEEEEDPLKVMEEPKPKQKKRKRSSSEAPPEPENGFFKECLSGLKYPLTAIPTLIVLTLYGVLSFISASRGARYAAVHTEGMPAYLITGGITFAAALGFFYVIIHGSLMLFALAKETEDKPDSIPVYIHGSRNNNFLTFLFLTAVYLAPAMVMGMHEAGSEIFLFNGRVKIFLALSLPLLPMGFILSAFYDRSQSWNPAKVFKCIFSDFGAYVSLLAILALFIGLGGAAAWLLDSLLNMFISGTDWPRIVDDTIQTFIWCFCLFYAVTSCSRCFGIYAVRNSRETGFNPYYYQGTVLHGACKAVALITFIAVFFMLGERIHKQTLENMPAKKEAESLNR